MKLSLMTQRLIFPLGSPECWEGWCWHLLRWHQHCSSWQSSTTGRQHCPDPYTFGCQKSSRCGILGKCQLSLHEAGADGTQGKPHPDLRYFWLFLHYYPPPTIYFPALITSRWLKGVTTSLTPALRHLQQHHLASVHVSMGQDLWRNKTL